MPAKLTTKAGRFRAVQWPGPSLGPSKFLMIAAKWGAKIGPTHPEDGSLIIGLNDRARHVAVGDWLVRFGPDKLAVMPLGIVTELFEVAP